MRPEVVLGLLVACRTGYPPYEIAVDLVDGPVPGGVVPHCAFLALYDGERLVRTLVRDDEEEGPDPLLARTAPTQGWSGGRVFYHRHHQRTRVVLLARQWTDLLETIDTPLEASLVASFQEGGRSYLPAPFQPNVVARAAGYDVRVVDCDAAGRGTYLRMHVGPDASVRLRRDEGPAPDLVCRLGWDR